MEKTFNVISNNFKELPNNIEAEQSVLGSILLSNEIFDEVNTIISNKNFYDPMHQKIFAAIEKLIFKGMLANPITLKNYFENEKDEIKCFSNVCTHRGNIVINDPGKYRNLICGYHGRKFDLNGKFMSMPEFQDVKDFPSACDHLHEFKIEKLGPFLFAGINPKFEINDTFKIMNERIGFVCFFAFHSK